MEFGLILTGVVTVWFAVLGAAAAWAAMNARAQEVPDEELAARVLGLLKWTTLLLGVPMFGLALLYFNSTASRSDFGAISFFTVVGGFFFLLLSYIAAIVLGTIGNVIVRRLPPMPAAFLMFGTFVAMPGFSFLSMLAQYAASRGR